MSQSLSKQWQQEYDEAVAAFEAWHKQARADAMRIAGEIAEEQTRLVDVVTRLANGEAVSTTHVEALQHVGATFGNHVGAIKALMPTPPPYPMPLDLAHPVEPLAPVAAGLAPRPAQPGTVQHPTPVEQAQQRQRQDDTQQRQGQPRQPQPQGQTQPFRPTPAEQAQRQGTVQHPAPARNPTPEEQARQARRPVDPPYEPTPAQHDRQHPTPEEQARQRRDPPVR